jgi:hypothetical protein
MGLQQVLVVCVNMSNVSWVCNRVLVVCANMSLLAKTRSNSSEPSPVDTSG